MLRTMGMLLLVLLLQGGALAVSEEPFKATLHAGRVVLKDPQGNLTWKKAMPHAFRVHVSKDRVLVFSRNVNLGTHTVQAFDLKGKPVWNRTHSFGHGGEWFYRSHLMLRLVGGDAKSWMGILRLRDGEGFLPISGSVLRTEGNLILLFSERKMNPYDPVNIELERVDLDTLQSQPLSFRVKARPRCGALQEVYGDRETGDRFTSQHVYAVREDGCGVFVTRFNWAKDGQPVWVYPKP